MKTLKKVLIGVLSAPFVLVLLFVLFEIFGMIVNHTATGIQTNTLHRDIRNAFPKTEIISVESQTGNTSGTGNHVDCKTEITFTSDLPLSEVQNKLSDRYEWNEWHCYVDETDTAGEYLFYLRTSAPFPDNIEGH